MHICFLSNEYPKKKFPHGGIGSFISIMAKNLVKQNIQVSVIGINNYTKVYEEYLDEGVNIYRLVPSEFVGLKWLFNSQNIAKKVMQINEGNKIDVVESPELGFSFTRKKPTIKYVIRLHGGHHFFAESENRKIDAWRGLKEKLSFKHADAFIAVSKYVKLHTEKYLSYHNKPVGYINNPISFKKFSPIENIEVIENNIVFVGTVCEKKGIRQLIQALQIVLVKYPNAKLDVYGQDWNSKEIPSYIQFLQKEFTSAQLENVSFKGHTAHSLLPNIYQTAHVCVFPSHMETLGLVAPEAMAMEKPVIFTKLGPGPEIIDDFKTGLLVNPLNPEEIADKIIWVFEHDDEVAIIGKKARLAAIEKFDIEKIIHQNIDFYTNIINKK
jgi:glycosyltransferase involved in cell wall biosynthesis